MVPLQRRLDLVGLGMATAGVLQLLAASIVAFTADLASTEQRLDVLVRQTGPFPALLMLLGLAIAIVRGASPSGAVVIVAGLGAVAAAFVALTGLLLALTGSAAGGIRVGRAIADVATALLAGSAIWLAFAPPSGKQLDPEA